MTAFAYGARALLSQSSSQLSSNASASAASAAAASATAAKKTALFLTAAAATATATATIISNDDDDNKNNDHNRYGSSSSSCSYSMMGSSGSKNGLYPYSYWGLRMSSPYSFNSVGNKTFCDAAAAATAAVQPPTPTSVTPTTTLRIKKPAVNLRERMTAIGHFSLVSETKFNPSIVTFVIELENSKKSNKNNDQPLTTTELCQLWEERGMSQRHPRFHRSLSSEQPGYFQPKQYNNDHDDDTASSSNNSKSAISVKEHISDTIYPINRQDLQARVRQLQMTTWDLNDSLWHMYVAGLPPKRQKRKGLLEKDDDNDDKKDDDTSKSMLIFRGHHLLGDGASMGAVLMDLFDEGEGFRQQIVRYMAKLNKTFKRLSVWEQLVEKWRRLLWFVTGSLQALSYQASLLFHSFYDDQNPWTIIQKEAKRQAKLLKVPTTTTLESDGGNSKKSEDQLQKRRVVSWIGSAAPVEQVAWVAKQLAGPKATINDVYVSCVTAALAKQLEYHRQWYENKTDGKSTLPKQHHMNITVPVHLKGGVVLPGESMGNNIGAFCVRLPGENDKTETHSCQDRLVAVHESLMSIKQTPAPFLSFLMAKTLSTASHYSLFPQRWISKLVSAASAGSVAVVTNVRGPPEDVHLAGRRVKNIYGFVPLAPGLPIGVVVQSYAGRMQLTLTAEPWAVPDADRFLGWMLQEYLQLLQAAEKKHELQQKLKQQR